MKRITALVMVISILLATCFCGTALAAAEISKEDICGQWVDTNTGYVLTIDENGRYELNKRSSSSLDYCEYGDGYLYVDNGFDENLNVVMTENGINLTNNAWSFYRLTEMPMTELAIDESGTESNIGLKIKSVEFLDEIPRSTYDLIYDFDREEVALGEGQVYACVTYELTNNNKSAIIVGDYSHNLELTISYNDGFLFSTEDEATDIFATNDTLSIYNRRGGRGEIELQPLATKTFYTFIKVPSVLAENTEAPLDVIFALFYDVDAQFYKCSIR